MEPDSVLITSAKVRRMLAGISKMTLRRWSSDENYRHLGFPGPIKIAGRNYWKREEIEQWIEDRKLNKQQ